MLQHLFKTLLNVIPRPWLIQLSYFVRPFLVVFLKGNRYTDPIDRTSFKKFLPYGYVHQRDNVLSPSTLSLERHRLLWLYLERETSFFSESLKLMHIAPEQAFYDLFKKIETLEYTTVDLHSPLADIKADICSLPFSDASFDVILCNHVLEHIPDHQLALSELYRVLKPGGWGILQVPQDLNRASTFQDDSIVDPKERSKIFGQYDHVRVYGRDYPHFLEKAGFNVEMVDYTHSLTDAEIERYRIAKGELIPLIRKPI